MAWHACMYANTHMFTQCARMGLVFGALAPVLGQTTGSGTPHELLPQSGKVCHNPNYT